MNIFNERIRELRIEHGMTQDQLSKLIFVERGTISKYEVKGHFPDIDILIRIADVFDVTLDYLVGRTDCQTK